MMRLFSLVFLQQKVHRICTRPFDNTTRYTLVKQTIACNLETLITKSHKHLWAKKRIKMNQQLSLPECCLLRGLEYLHVTVAGGTAHDSNDTLTQSNILPPSPFYNCCKNISIVLSCYAMLPPNASAINRLSMMRPRHENIAPCVSSWQGGSADGWSCPQPTDQCLIPFVHSTCLVSFHLCIHVSCRSCSKSRHHLTRHRLSTVFSHVNLKIPGFCHYYLLTVISSSMNVDNIQHFSGK